MTVEFNDALLQNTLFTIANCSTRIILDKMRVYQRSVTDAGVLISGCKHVRIQGGRVRSLPTATTATAGIQGDSGSNVYVTGMDFYGSWRAFRCNSGAQGISVNNKGDCRLGVDGAVMIAYGTQPCDQSTFAYASPMAVSSTRRA